ncbi:MAG: alpha/beta hydrolase [Planctomycetota bacterium]|nr:alpha/beta hydrolase [Planctomycetota bacterium]
MKTCLCALLLALSLSFTPCRAAELGEEGFADSDGVKIHYVTAGEGPLVVLLHGFPDFSYSWRDQMPSLAKNHQVVALDLRGYNKSDQPEGVENYAMEKLVGDVAAVVKHLRRDRATIVGHDWGGAIAWSFAMHQPELTERLIILNLPHPKGLLRELKNNPEQQKNSAYAKAFQRPEAAKAISPEALVFWVKEPEAREKYLEAFRRSSLEGMLNFYKANYPREPYDATTEFPQIKCPVLMIHGLDDTALLPGALNDTWKWIDSDFTLVTVPKAGHWVHRDRPELVTKTMVGWLAEHPVKAKE